MFTASARAIQRNYRSLFDQVKRKKTPLFILKGSKPEMVILSLSMYEEFLRNRGVEQTSANFNSRFCTDLPWRRTP